MVEIVPQHRFETPGASAAERPAKKVRSPKQKKEKTPKDPAKAERKERKIRDGNFSQAIFILGNIVDGDNQSVFVKLGNQDYQMADIVKSAKFRVKTPKADKDQEASDKEDFVEVAIDGEGRFVFPV